MMKKNNTLYYAALCVVLAGATMMSGCLGKSYYDREIIGNWFSTVWLQEGSDTGLRAMMSFREDKTYYAVFQDNSEHGTWRIESHKLYMTADGEQQIMVRIDKLDGDDLEISMNRGGLREKVTLMRANE